MRYSATHKQETRHRVVRAAAAVVRAKGLNGVGVAEVMAAAGLTHGGFYAHFPNRQALIVAAIEEAFAQSHRRFAQMTEAMGAQEALSVFIDDYVSIHHRNNPNQGCPISTLAGDLPRQGQAVRDAFDRGVGAVIARLEAWLPAGDAATRRDLASSIVAEMAGAVALSRAVSDDATALRLLEASRVGVKARLGLSAGVTAALSKRA